MQKSHSYLSSKSQTFDIIITSFLIALVFVSTVFINIKLPIGHGGLVHLGTAMLFIASILFGPKKGAIAGAAGMGLFDIMAGWTLWAPITIVARGLQGYIVGKMAWGNGRNGNSVGYNLLATVISIPVMISVYYIGEGILYANWIAPLASIPGDLIQNGLGIIIAIPVCIVLRKLPIFK